MIKDYVWVANCDGLHSLYPVTECNCNFFALQMYCRYNAHRYEIWGIIELEDEIYSGMKHLMETGSGQIEALKLLKTTKFSISSNLAKEYVSMLSKIPNPSLDYTRRHYSQEEQDFINKCLDIDESKEKELENGTERTGGSSNKESAAGSNVC